MAHVNETHPLTSGRGAARLCADLLLLVVAMIWGTAFVAQRLAAGSMSNFLFNGSRFLLAALALAPLTATGLFRRPQDPPGVRLDRRSRLGIFAAGCLLVGGAVLQQAGLSYTTAGNAGFITGLYVVLIPIILAVFTRHRPRPAIWLAAGMAVVGLFLLSTGGRPGSVNRGDLLELAGTIFWALHVILTGRLVQRINVLHFSIGQYLVCAVVNLLAWLALEGAALPVDPRGWWGVAYAGLISVGLGYTLQATAQREAPPADAAILLSLEAVFAALAGWALLGEVLGGVQMLGCAVMLAGMLLAQVAPVEPTRAAAAPASAAVAVESEHGPL
ncbi:MAG: DMT family transporter [Chloroflexota bacterium]